MTGLWGVPGKQRSDWRKALWPLRTVKWWQWMLVLIAALGYVWQAGSSVTFRGLFANSALILILLMFLEDTWKRRQPEDDLST